MMQHLPTIAKLMKMLQQVPYLASKNLYRVTEHFLNLDEQKMEQFCAALLQAKQSIGKCPICYCWQEKESTCYFCGSEKRNQEIEKRVYNLIGKV